MNTFHKGAIVVAASAVMVFSIASVLLAGRRVDMTLQKSVMYTSPRGNQVEGGLRIHLDRDQSGYRLTKEGWVAKAVAGRKLEGNAALAVDSRHAR